MTKHARFAPSAAERWLACPASIRLIEQCLLKGLNVRDVLATQDRADIDAQVTGNLAQ